ncbi:MAG: DUF2442 domain-containing protein [Magnetococcales bacterium]|nr:DUF2442 domain-containing protein [Magnetococcales bacterium]
MVTVQSVDYLGDYRLRLTFNTGESGIADWAELAHTVPSAVPLREVSEFRRVYLDPWPTLAWPCGFALAPEYADRLVTGKAPAWEKVPIAQTA